MIQYIKFATHDPEGFALIKAEDVSGIASTTEEDVCKLITNHGDYLIAGSIDLHIENMQSYFGTEWSSVPENVPE